MVHNLYVRLVFEWLHLSHLKCTVSWTENTPGHLRYRFVAQSATTTVTCTYWNENETKIKVNQTITTYTTVFYVHFTELPKRQLNAIPAHWTAIASSICLKWAKKKKYKIKIQQSLSTAIDCENTRRKLKKQFMHFKLNGKYVLRFFSVRVRTEPYLWCGYFVNWQLFL